MLSDICKPHVGEMLRVEISERSRGIHANLEAAWQEEAGAMD